MQDLYFWLCGNRSLLLAIFSTQSVNQTHGGLHAIYGASFCRVIIKRYRMTCMHNQHDVKLKVKHTLELARYHGRCIGKYDFHLVMEVLLTKLADHRGLFQYSPHITKARPPISGKHNKKPCAMLPGVVSTKQIYRCAPKNRDAAIASIHHSNSKGPSHE